LLYVLLGVFALLGVFIFWSWRAHVRDEQQEQHRRHW